MLAAKTKRGDAHNGGRQQLMISEEAEESPFQNKAEVFDCAIGSKQFPVKSAIPFHWLLQFLAVKRQGLTGTIFNLLQDAPNVCVGSVHCQKIIAFGRGAQGACHYAALAATNVVSAWTDHARDLGLPNNRSVRGRRVPLPRG